MVNTCWKCGNRREIPGDFHITCTNPPEKRMEIGAGGDERYEMARQMAEENEAVVRCIWGGSGSFPICFDENTVFACANLVEG